MMLFRAKNMLREGCGCFVGEKFDYMWVLKGVRVGWT